ncbi:GNAT family N-acetyltransferase [Pseudonocardia spinosispora]|uniref:GNAT family N-acetyltransferase n=1 Tax=Pseudonocardia spinosispora TaxID=103441 RepID=UPI00041F625F|nr:GNAT family N-acetyltransferase [Pseudonocardia spinosispora]
MILSPRLVIRPLTAGEAERSLSDTEPDSLTFADGYPSSMATEILRLVALYPMTGEQDDDRPDLGPWLVVRQLDDAVIGAVTCARTAEPSTVTVGYDFAQSCWGSGYATETLGAVVEHLLSVPEVWRVCAETTVDHSASRRVMEKAGLRWQRDETEFEDGREVKIAHYAIDRPAPI